MTSDELASYGFLLVFTVGYLVLFCWDSLSSGNADKRGRYVVRFRPRTARISDYCDLRWFRLKTHAYRFMRTMQERNRENVSIFEYQVYDRKTGTFI